MLRWPVACITPGGGISRYHRHGGELIFQIGTAYFGCRDEEGRFNLDKLKDVVAGAPVRALEIKLSQGAKPSLGGLFPAPKVSRRSRPPAAFRRGATASVRHGTPSSPTPTACSTGWNYSLPTGLPVGIKAAVGDLDFWYELADLMGRRDGEWTS